MITWHTGSFDRVHVRCEPAGIISPLSTTRCFAVGGARNVTLNFPKCVYPRPIVASCPSRFNEWESACALERACACGGGLLSRSMLSVQCYSGLCDTMSDNYIVLADAVLSRSFCFGSLLFTLATLTRVAIANSGYERESQRVAIECLYNVIGTVNF